MVTAVVKAFISPIPSAEAFELRRIRHCNYLQMLSQPAQVHRRPGSIPPIQWNESCSKSCWIRLEPTINGRRERLLPANSANRINQWIPQNLKVGLIACWF
jgi:hypothetical protein